jgi:hypothetical protein
MPIDDRPKFIVPAAKTGLGADALFGLGPFLCIGDPYRDPSVRSQRPPRSKDDDRGSFKPPGPIHFPLSDYPAFLSTEPAEPKAKKELVVVRGVYPSASLGPRGFPEHMPDDYDAGKRDAAERADFPPFSVAAPGLMPFTAPKEIFYADKPRGGSPLPRQKPPASDTAPFRPGGASMNLGKFPVHMPDPIQEHVRVIKQPSERPSWRDATPLGAFKEQSSVIFNNTNLRKQFPTVFRRNT